MAELQKFMQASNGAFKSDLMKTFVAKHRGDSLDFRHQTSAVPVINQNVTSGAGIFSTTASTTNTNTSTTGLDTTDNANILLQKSVTDNNQTSRNTASDTSCGVIDNKTASPIILQPQDNGNNESNRNAANVNNANLNVANTKAVVAPGVAAPELPDTNANVSEINAVLEEVRGAMTENRQMLVQQITDATVDAHLATCMNTYKAVADATARFMAMKEAGQLPDMSKLSLSAGSMWEKMMEQMMPELAKAMKFCKMLPGFTELCLDDQMKLIKQGTFEVMMTRFAMLIDNEKETMLDPSHKMVCPRQVIQAMPMGKFLDGFFFVGSQFNPIGLTDGEIGLFTAVLIFNPSRLGLTDSKLISTIQSLYQQALFSLLKQNHSDPEARFSKVLGLVPMFRRINDEHAKAMSAMQMKSPDAYEKQFPPIHKELYTQESQ